MKQFIAVIGFLFLQFSHAQTPKSLNSDEIFQSIKKLNFLGSVLYVGAHPDDENTKIISYFSNEVHAQTAYLALTRGDGGQNLIGPEIRELLGVIRTEELLAARKIDGGQQFFTRANDFGYSKNPEETFQFWDKQKVLSDVVWVMRNFQPDVVIDRFNHRTEGDTHGHHTASARLSVEAFDLANDKTKFPKQLKYTKTWQPKHLYFNTSPWFYNSQKDFEKAVKQGFSKVDVGTYYPLRGISNTEIASRSRSQHKSQGFGNTAERGSQPDYLEFIKGNKPKNASVFAGIDTSWNRLKDGNPIEEILTEVEKNYDFQHPEKSLPNLVKAYALIKNLNDEHWQKIKTKEISKIITACAGLYLEATTPTNFAVAGDAVQVNFEATNRNAEEIALKSIDIAGKTLNKNSEKLEKNQAYYDDYSLQIPKNSKPDTPYWLTEPGSVGMYTVNDQELIGKPETPKSIQATFNLEIEGEEISVTRSLVFKTNDPVKGEVYKPFHIVPKISVKTSAKTLIFADQDSKKIDIQVKAFQKNTTGELGLKLPNDWKVSPKKVKLDFKEKGQEKTIPFTITPPSPEAETYLSPIFTSEGQGFSDELNVIDYDHIPQQTVLLPAKTKLIKLNIQKKGDLIGYVPGAGDVVPENLRAIGYRVDLIPSEEISARKLKKYDAIVMGIRAYNTDKMLKYKQATLMDYVKNGGTMIVQYNTNRGLVTDELGPYPLQVSRDRTTDEFSDIQFLTPEHPVLNTPNKITQKDFEGWVQERGLYFPDEWSKKYTPILGMHDKDEAQTKGSLLVTSFGKGHYIYTGLSFFREFPAGVSGAFRLFANLISLGNE